MPLCLDILSFMLILSMLTDLGIMALNKFFAKKFEKCMLQNVDT